MPIEVEVLQNGTGLLLICRGKITGKEKIQIMERLLASPESVSRLRYIVIDQADAHLDLSPQDLRILAGQARCLAKIAPAAVVAAIIAPREVDYGMARMWQVFVEETGWETMVFRSIDEADSTLREKVGAWAGVNSQRTQGPIRRKA
ncbi:MAG: hypothetical protein JWN45_2928 [Acidobacteriaceae bacterium]|nr:hypothetical protein [Acidobacteriaceae bacterium]